MVTGKTKNLAVIGFPVEHSLSPAMQNAAITAAGVDYSYIAVPIAPQDLPAAVAGFKAMRFAGFNVTIPHKQTIMPLLDDIDEAAKIIGAVNTVVNDGGKLKGYNTDALGFIGAFAQKNKSPHGKNAAILGAGGAARAIVHALTKAGANRVTIGARNANKAEALANVFAARADVQAFSWDAAEFSSALREADIIVNATPLGMAPNTDEAPPVDWERIDNAALVYDIIYTPAKTKFLAGAEKCGHETINGEYMLAAQGAAAFKLWTGKEADLSVMQKALRASLSSR